MNPENIDRAVEALRHLLQGERDVQSAVLYCSVARGTAGSDSDIDILILVPSGPIVRLREAIHDIESTFDVNISPILLRPDDVHRLDRQFLDSVLREGMPLAGRPLRVTLDDLRLRPIRVVSFDLSHLDPPEKMRLSRQLDGYATVRRRGRKRYERKVDGFLKDVGGWRVGRGAVVVPEAALSKLEEILSNAKAKRWTIAAWAQAP
ncbi:MAG TPA: nucleotidyltransferase domain-containing protein [Thermoplasmata archaeon]|nr:nucleotidyltransferase domain-containing protein [Thermoplasmata archaeon]